MPIAIQESVRIMIHRRRHQKGILDSCWRGCPAKVHRTFTGHPLFCKKCRIQENVRVILISTNTCFWASFSTNPQNNISILGQLANFSLLGKFLVLIGLEVSAFLFTLLIMEPTMGGEGG